MDPECRVLTARGLADRVRALTATELGRLREAIRDRVGDAFLVVDHWRGGIRSGLD